MKATSPPSLSASLADRVWQTALRVDSFVDFSDRRSAQLQTVAYLLYDDKNVYVAFHCAQRGVPITATQNVDNAGVGSDDHVAFLVDTSGNGSRTYEFEVSPKGVHDESASENARYAPRWQSLAAVLPGGDYNVLMVIPMRDLRAQRAAVQRWRINFVRYVAARSARYTWAYEPAQTDVTSAQNWPVLDGLRIAAGATRPRPHADPFLLQSFGQSQIDRHAGIDVTYPFTDTLAFVGTLDPDFSNVEQDQATIAPQEFRRFLTEYRPFFAQGASYINALPNIEFGGPGNSMFYTPSIGVFDRGLKIEGTAGRNAVGVLNALGPDLNDTAYGYAYTLPDKSLSISSEGVLARHAGVDDNTAGLGVTTSNPHSGVFTMARYASESGTAIADPSASHALLAVGGVQNNRFTAYAMYQDVGAQYSPLDGFTQLHDARGPGVWIAYHGNTSDSSPIKRYTVTAAADRQIASDGTVHEADVFGMIDMDFKNLITLHAFAGPSELSGQWYNRRMIGLGYKEDTSSPTQVSYYWGPFGGMWVQQLNSSLVRSFGTYGISLEFDGNIERTARGGPIFDSQWLRRISLTRSFGRDAALALGIRSINGAGGFADPGTNLALSYQQRFANEDLLYLVYGTPAASQTLHRFIVKYVFHLGGESGT
ncbi:MAG TPA: hypothetical protein VJP85_03515 [Candidatus Baltobacteraceae bacterium]|nr:hypothetical protein [Candidatus Baltobacteraceae bacterium]